MKFEWPDKDGNMVRGAVPEHVQPFVKAIGLEATTKLLMAFTGETVTVERKPKSYSWLVREIGRDKSDALGRAFGFYQALPIPVANRFLCRMLRAQGLDIGDIARMIGLSPLSVLNNVRAKQPARPNPEYGEAS